MVDKLVLDVHYSDDRGLVTDPYVVVTPDVAQEILAMARKGEQALVSADCERTVKATTHAYAVRYAETMTAERDRALAERDAAVESERRFRAEVEAGFRKHGLAAGPTAIDRLVEDLAAAKARKVTAPKEPNTIDMLPGSYSWLTERQRWIAAIRAAGIEIVE